MGSDVEASIHIYLYQASKSSKSVSVLTTLLGVLLVIAQLVVNRELYENFHVAISTPVSMYLMIVLTLIPLIAAGGTESGATLTK